MTDNELKAYLEDAEKNPRQIAAAVSGLPDKVLRYKPAPDKWSILEVLGHIADIEIVYAYVCAKCSPILSPILRAHGPKCLGKAARISGNARSRVQSPSTD